MDLTLAWPASALECMVGERFTHLDYEIKALDSMMTEFLMLVCYLTIFVFIGCIFLCNLVKKQGE
jgi:hypothetical protein